MTHLYRPFFALTLCVWLASCAALGVPQADTFNKRIVVANSVAETSATTIATLVSAGKLSPEEAQKALDQTKNAAAGVDLARKVYAQDPSAANTQLGAIIASLNALTLYLESRQ
jgi:polyhydroxyalkanoate synthesis regulator phasin